MKNQPSVTSPPVGHILVVDDIEMNRDLLARRLTRRGMTVSLASSGKEALNMVGVNDYDLMLLDIAMPQMNGLDVLRHLRQEKSDAELPVIMVTARTDSKDVVEALKSGANDYVTKPIDFPVLLARSRTQLSRRQAMASLHESEERYALAMRGSSAGLWDWDIAGDTMFYSARWKAMLGYAVAEVSDDPKEWWSRVHDDDSTRLQETLAQHLRQESLQFECEYRLRHSDGSYRWMMGRGIAIRDQNGQASRVTGSQIDTTEAKTIDALTSLPNRTFFVDQLQRALERRSKNDEKSFVVMFLDVDRFKLLNDSMGHDVGDEFLCQVGKRIDEAVSRPKYTDARTHPILARMGGDEFAVLLTDVASKGISVDLAESILQAFEDPFDMRGQAVVASSSIGIVVAGESHSSSEDLLRDADNAMYRAKAAGGGSFVEFDQQMHALAVARLKMESDLRVCLDQQQLAVYYQPIIDIATEGVVGFEALVRWIHPEKGFISPVDFIPVAEETGMIDRIGRFVFKESVEQLSEWRRNMPKDEPLTVAVNLSRRQFIHRDLAEFLDATLKQAGLESKHIKLEITESTVLGDEELVQHAITSLKALGIQLSMDDFGTGYSSLSLLHNIPFDVLKVDRSFISRIDEDARLVNTIIQLAGNFGLQVVAEGVETEDQLEVLRTMGCDFAQGYYFSRPLPADQATKMLQNRGMVSDC